MHSAQITKRLKSPRWWWWCLIISKLNISATKQKYLPCPAKVPFSLLDKLYLILLPTFQKPFRMALKKQLRENHPQTCTHCFLGTDFFSGPSPSTIINHKKYPCTHAQETGFGKGLEEPVHCERQAPSAGPLSSVWDGSWLKRTSLVAQR